MIFAGSGIRRFADAPQVREGSVYMTGFVFLDKGEGMTSFFAASRLRRIFGTKKIGHTGTLDPDATGVLPVCLGKATKVCETWGAALDAIEKGERFSCPDCYKALRSKLFSLFSEMHGATRHIGKVPKKFDSTELEEAMESDYVESITEADIEEIDQVVKEAFEQMLPNLNLSATESSLSDDTPKQKKSTKAELIKKLNEAISDERYEDAALIRDQLKDISTQ